LHKGIQDSLKLGLIIKMVGTLNSYLRTGGLKGEKAPGWVGKGIPPDPGEIDREVICFNKALRKRGADLRGEGFRSSVIIIKLMAGAKKKNGPH